MRIGRSICGMLLVALCLSMAQTASPAWADEVIRLGVMRFTSKTEDVSQQQAEIITDVFTRTLSNSRSIAVIERERLDLIGREHKFNMSGLVDMGMAVRVGRLAGCQYMLMGSVTELSERASAGGLGGLGGLGRIGGIVGMGNRDAVATIDARVVDVTTGEIIVSLAESGTASEYATAVRVAGLSVAEAQFGGLKARAVAAATSRLGHRIRETLVGDYAHVVSVRGKDVNINRGLTSGVKPGDIYRVYDEGAEVRDIDGTSLGRDVIDIAVLKVKDVRNEFSVAEVAPNGGKVENVRRGDKIEVISQKEAKALVDRKAFVSERPRKFGEADIPNVDGRLREIAAEQEAQHAVQPSYAQGGPIYVDPGPAYPEPDLGYEDGYDLAPRTPRSEPVPVVPPLSPWDPEPEPERPSASERWAVTPMGKGVEPPARHLENESTDPAKVVPSYGLYSGDANNRRIAHIAARSLGNSKAGYERYVELASSYSGDYLAAYKAGDIARRLGRRDDAVMWTERALAANPNYEPAQSLKAQLEKSSRSGGKKRKK